jgi:hypothetical protein
VTAATVPPSREKKSSVTTVGCDDAAAAATAAGLPRRPIAGPGLEELPLEELSSFEDESQRSMTHDVVAMGKFRALDSEMKKEELSARLGRAPRTPP